MEFAFAIETSDEAARVFKQESKLMDYALIRGNLGVAYRLLAEQEVPPGANLEQSADTLNGALFLLKEQSVWDNYV